MSTTAQQHFLHGLGLGIGAAALLFYFWHTETVYQLQQSWLAEQKNLILQQQAQHSPKQQIETIDLLMKAYAVTPGTEEQDLRNLLNQNGHLQLLEQLQQQTPVDLADLIVPGRPLSAASLYAALLRLKQQQEKQLAMRLLNERAAKQ